MDMGGMDMTGFRMIPAGIGIMLPANEPWRAIEFAYVFLMWAVMMVGMMAPSAAPMILMYARVGRQGKAQGKPFAATGWFAAGISRRDQHDCAAGAAIPIGNPAGLPARSPIGRKVLSAKAQGEKITAANQPVAANGLPCAFPCRPRGRT